MVGRWGFGAALAPPLRPDREGGGVVGRGGCWPPAVPPVLPVLPVLRARVGGGVAGRWGCAAFPPTLRWARWRLGGGVVGSGGGVRCLAAPPSVPPEALSAGAAAAPPRGARSMTLSDGLVPASVFSLSARPADLSAACWVFSAAARIRAT